jgi:hypothetical protein
MSNGTFCSGQLNRLADARNKLAILFNTIKDPDLRVKFKSDRDEIEQLIYESNNNQVCPDNETVMFIVTEVNNEYTKYYNS